MRIRSLDSMRGIAAVMVVLGHFVHLSPLGEAQTTLGLRVLRRILGVVLDGGASVDFFFVLSGFVLSLPHVAPKLRPVQVDDFVLRRFLRIMPTYWASVLVALGLRWLCGTYSTSLPRTLGIDWLAPLNSDGLIGMLTLIFDAPIMLINGPLWSLQVEMRMSLLLPFVIAAVALGPKRAAMVTILMVWLAVSTFVGGPSGIGFFPLFVLGAMLAHGSTGLVERARAASSAQRAAVLVLATLLFYNRSLQHVWAFPDMGQEYLTGLGSSLVMILVLAKAPALLTHRAATFLGDISYSLYVMHLPLLMAGMSVLVALFGWSIGSASLVALPLSVVGSIALYFMVERPSIEIGRKIMSGASARQHANPALATRPSQS